MGILFKTRQRLKRVLRIQTNRIRTGHAVRIYKDGYAVPKPTRRGRAKLSGPNHPPEKQTSPTPTAASTGGVVALTCWMCLPGI